jgi:hypothetical protein
VDGAGQSPDDQSIIYAVLNKWPVTLDNAIPSKEELANFGVQTSNTKIVQDRLRYLQKQQKAALVATTLRSVPSHRQAKMALKRAGYSSGVLMQNAVLQQYNLLPQRQTSDRQQLDYLESHSEDQNWPSIMAIDVPDMGKGVIATTCIPKGNMVCDYHGELITHKQFQHRIESGEGNNYQYTFTFNLKKWCIDSGPERCKCHNRKLMGRLINHCPGTPEGDHRRNVKPKAVFFKGKPAIIFIARREIYPMEQLFYDYGVRTNQFGEASDQTWLDRVPTCQ